eukprot:1199369-Amphidinium_carterae.1
MGQELVSVTATVTYILRAGAATPRHQERQAGLPSALGPALARGEDGFKRGHNVILDELLKRGIASDFRCIQVVSWLRMGRLNRSFFARHE